MRKRIKRIRLCSTGVGICVVLAVVWGILAVPETARAAKPPKECIDYGSITFRCNMTNGQPDPNCDDLFQGDDVEPYSHGKVTGPASGNIYVILSKDWFLFKEFVKKSDRTFGIDFSGWTGWPDEVPQTEVYQTIKFAVDDEVDGTSIDAQSAWQSLDPGDSLYMQGQLGFGNKDNSNDYNWLLFGHLGRGDPLKITRIAEKTWTIEPTGCVALYGYPGTEGCLPFQMTFVADVDASGNYDPDDPLCDPACGPGPECLPALWSEVSNCDPAIPECDPVVSAQGTGGALPESTFLRGDSNADGDLNITDPVHTLGYLFLGGPAPSCPDAADSDDNGKVEISDPVFTLNWLFLGHSEPPPPGSDFCGPDTTEDALTNCNYDPARC